MAGVYVHVPFCKVKCHYCDFHFSTNLKNRIALVEAICKEISIRQDYLKDDIVETIYFGGGTPSILETDLIQTVITTIRSKFTISKNCEITFECNPDDLNAKKLADLYQIGVNRLSIGIQSFDDELLQFMNRAHNSNESLNAVTLAKQAGFNDITIDLIYGIPGLSLDKWKQTLNQSLKLEVGHISAYCLTIEKDTVFGRWHSTGKLDPFPDDKSLEQFQYLMDFAKENEFEQYEISNFSRPNSISRHNSAYWLGEKYLGIGPSAHSYDGESRQWNIANNALYIKFISKKQVFFERETLSKSDQFNDYILTRLRTKWGLNSTEMNQVSFQMTKNVESEIKKHIRQGNVEKKGEIYRLTDQGKYLADAISADLFQ